jgi:hypothetical protein
VKDRGPAYFFAIIPCAGRLAPPGIEGGLRRPRQWLQEAGQRSLALLFMGLIPMEAPLCVGARIRVIRPSSLNGCCINEKGHIVSVTWLDDDRGSDALYVCEMDRPGKNRLVALRHEEIVRDE